MLAENRIVFANLQATGRVTFVLLSKVHVRAFRTLQLYLGTVLILGHEFFLFELNLYNSKSDQEQPKIW